MLKQQILDDLKSAMKAGDAVKRDALRMLDSMVKNAEIEKKKRETGLSDEEVQEVIARAIKQRRDSLAQFESAGREDLAQKERADLEILSAYMPEQMDEVETRKIVEETIAEMNATAAQKGQVMGALMGKLKGRADGNLVRQIVEEILK